MKLESRDAKDLGFFYKLIVNITEAVDIDDKIVRIVWNTNAKCSFYIGNMIFPISLPTLASSVIIRMHYP